MENEVGEGDEETAAEKVTGYCDGHSQERLSLADDVYDAHRLPCFPRSLTNSHPPRVGKQHLCSPMASPVNKAIPVHHNSYRKSDRPSNEE